MKKLSIYLLLVFAGLTVTSCVEPISPQPEHNTGKYGINLSVICQSLETKATKHGEDQYNENLLSTVDWFIFTSDADESVLVKHGHVAKDTESGTLDQGTSEQLVTQAIKVNKDPIPMDDYIASGKSSGYIFLVANAPKSITVTDRTTTLEYLRNLDVTANFGALTSGGKFQEQDNFVMTGGKDFTFTAQEPVLTRTVELSRIAAKVSLNVSVVPAIDEIITMPNGKKMYKQTWYPDLSKIQIYLSYADNHAVVAGTPDEFSSPGGSLFTYDRNAFTANYSYTGYSGTTSVDPDAITPTWTNPNWKWNVTGSPFYSYPMKWKTVSPYTPFIKIILPWTAYKEPTTVTTVTTDDGPTEVIKVGRFKGTTPDGEYSGQSSERIGQSNFYYKIPIPSANPEGEGDNKYLQLLQNEWYNLILDVAILGGTSDDLPLELAGQYFVVDWNNPDVQAGGVMKQGRYLSTATDTYYIYGGNDIEIPVSSSHEVIASITLREAFLDGNWKETTKRIRYNNQNYDVPINLTSRGTVSYSTDHKSAVDFTDDLVNAFGPTLDCFPLRFTLHLEHSDHQGPSKNIVIYQYPSIYIDLKEGGKSMVDGYYGNVSGARNEYGSYGGANYTRTPYGPITRSESGTQYMTVISVSSLAANPRYTLGGSTWDYLIADPRVDSGFPENGLTPYSTGSSTTDWGEQATKIKIGNPSKTTPNYIAPKFMISSRWGRLGDWRADTELPASFDERYNIVRDRCATYQEAGYPAGRWRLPTEAEIMFVAKLQQYNLISELFTSGGHSFASSGNYLTVAGESVYFNDPRYEPKSCRCVYDLWYWGEEPVNDGSTYVVAVE